MKRSPSLLSLSALAWTGALTLAMASRPAAAQTLDFTFTLDNPALVAPAGGTAVLQGSVDFTGPGDPVSPEFGGPLVVSGDLASVGYDPAFIKFFTSKPKAGASYHGPLEHFGIATGAPNGAGVVLSGSQISVFDHSGSIFHSYTVTVANPNAAVPEPGAYALLGSLGLTGIGLLRRRAR